MSSEPLQPNSVIVLWLVKCKTWFRKIEIPLKSYIYKKLSREGPWALSKWVSV